MKISKIKLISLILTFICSIVLVGCTENYLDKCPYCDEYKILCEGHTECECCGEIECTTCLPCPICEVQCETHGTHIYCQAGTHGCTGREDCSICEITCDECENHIYCDYGTHGCIGELCDECRKCLGCETHEDCL